MAKLASSSFALDFLRRLLCARTAGGDAQRDPPGLLTVPEPEGRSPCIVARLMGLDAMPSEAEFPRAQPLRRSRSASSAEGANSPCGSAAPAPTKVRASASLREKPAYLRAENDMFLLLSFSPEEQETTKKPGDDGGEEAERRRREDGPVGRQRRGRRRRRKLRFGDDDEAEEEELGRRVCCGQQQGSSPVSVLEAREVQEESWTTTTTSSTLEDAEPCSATSAEGAHFALEQQNSTKNLPSNVVQLDDMSPTTSPVHASRCSDGDGRNRRVVNRSEVSTPDVTGIWQPVCRLVEEGIKNMEWLTQDGANLIGEMDSEILDQLICEATVELVQLSSVSHAPKMFSQDEQSEVLEASEYEPRNCQWKSPTIQSRLAF
ncbi:hypothetical protein PR202_gb25019 [Eleusine coracana subsp. coracana]|uniref:DUF3741 domain-containing protein n=1 Tax=Eleusine coracana subsp. coracana TaxID=191504 RepID=A0AAV5FKI9_ELECO|nr:hypothetical protein QOZ80_5BG0454550 [Eleusine coracana subsp. coracana]GJN36179.1 hypothetical protein PR202_gb25019 [Eleusine coracana subsp. coracana]